MFPLSTNEVIIKVTRQQHPTILAKVTVSFDTKLFGYVTLKGFTVWKSPYLSERLGEYINITPTSARAYNRYFMQVFFESLEMWAKLEKQIYEEYKKTPAILEEVSKLQIDLPDLDNL